MLALVWVLALSGNTATSSNDAGGTKERHMASSTVDTLVGSPRDQHKQRDGWSKLDELEIMRLWELSVDLGSFAAN